MGDRTADNQKIISQGHAKAHGGHFKADAFLYSEEGRYIDEDGTVHPPRYDTNTFRCLYGVEPSIAEIINYTPTIQVLEKHATIEASDRLEATDALKARFDTFLRTLKEAGYPENYLNMMAPEYHQFKEVRSAYREFWAAT
ncbi:uncharacterized protein BO87DRAFT_304587 [Aspergillus neoniger CBS 115656]|uniref:Uncharacterized protein n=1 Tax=Aspergillus neoniger (strain CBS 115656) TaxID=1448310 RepID=A0A318Z6R4_ASPNB|nr:hypothetical protein BO87DRAFT_304587 [Aspergillus neoniger CBS 115656]PYH35898.1 hypothetical protein BO87DRAFT_304587 [Aspergillus neoniger CBS 115656]